ncbi:MAG TPA: DUF4236 domain-containing protein [Terriglobales bacterium]|nr:DUF4236 domain-containing protein [Terriglobales bacterium]
MGWTLRKSFKLLPGIRLNVSRSGPRVSFGIPGARASLDPRGRGRLYAGTGPLRYQKAVRLGGPTAAALGKLIERWRKLQENIR